MCVLVCFLFCVLFYYYNNTHCNFAQTTVPLRCVPRLHLLSTSVARLSCYEGKEFELQCDSPFLAYDKLYAKNSGARATRRDKRILGNVKFVFLKDIRLHSFCKVQAALVTITREVILAFCALNVEK